MPWSASPQESSPVPEPLLSQPLDEGVGHLLSVLGWLHLFMLQAGTRRGRGHGCSSRAPPLAAFADAATAGTSVSHELPACSIFVDVLNSMPLRPVHSAQRCSNETEF